MMISNGSGGNRRMNSGLCGGKWGERAGKIVDWDRHIITLHACMITQMVWLYIVYHHRNEKLNPFCVQGIKMQSVKIKTIFLKFKFGQLSFPDPSLLDSQTTICGWVEAWAIQSMCCVSVHPSCCTVATWSRLLQGESSQHFPEPLGLASVTLPLWGRTSTREVGEPGRRKGRGRGGFCGLTFWGLTTLPFSPLLVWIPVSHLWNLELKGFWIAEPWG